MADAATNPVGDRTKNAEEAAKLADEEQKRRVSVDHKAAAHEEMERAHRTKTATAAAAGATTLPGNASAMSAPFSFGGASPPIAAGSGTLEVSPSTAGAFSFGAAAGGAPPAGFSFGGGSSSGSNSSGNAHGSASGRGPHQKG